MATLTKTYAGTSSMTSNSSASAYDKLIERLKFSHFALISMTILIGSCAGGIASMYVFMNGAPFWQFVLGLAVSMANLVAAISQAPTKWVFNLFVLSVVINAFLIISNM